jgi:hypothetical protein
MTTKQGYVSHAAILATAVLFLSPLATLGQATAPAKPAQSTSSTTSAAKGDRWLHVRVICNDAKGETVRVNVPLEMAEKVLPAVNHDPLHGGKVKIDSAKTDDVDLKTLLEAVRSAKDGEYVTVQGRENDVRVAKQGDHLMIHIVEKDVEKGSKNSQVEVKVPMKVIDALLSAGKDELDLVAALHALAAQGDTELVSVKDKDNTVKVWVDSKNVSD